MHERGGVPQLDIYRSVFQHLIRSIIGFAHRQFYRMVTLRAGVKSCQGMCLCTAIVTVTFDRTHSQPRLTTGGAQTVSDANSPN